MDTAFFFLSLPLFSASIAMSAPPIVKATFQAALINAGSNVLAQGIKAYRDQVRTSVIRAFICSFVRSLVRSFDASVSYIIFFCLQRLQPALLLYL